MRSFSVTRLLVWSLIVVFLVQLFSVSGGVLPSSFDVRFGLSPLGVRLGHGWTFLTYGWLHSERGLLPWHLIWNLLWLRFLCGPIEAVLGWRRFLALYLATLLGAGAAWYFFSALQGGQGLLLGASGAVFGLLAAYVRLPQAGVGVIVQMALHSFFRVAVGFEVLCVLFGWLPGIAHWAHLGGAFAGWLGIRLLGPRIGKRASAPPSDAGVKADPASRPSDVEKEIPADEGFFSNYNSTPQPPEGS